MKTKIIGIFKNVRWAELLSALALAFIAAAGASVQSGATVRQATTSGVGAAMVAGAAYLRYPKHDGSGDSNS